MSDHTFELNGRTYDALTGALISQTKPAAQPAKAAPAAPRPANAISSRLQPAHRPMSHTRAASAGPKVSMDGMLGAAKPAVAHAQARPKHLPSQPKHFAHHQPQPTRTLMRRAVKAPALSTAKPAAMSPAAAKPVRGVAPTVVPKMSSTRINPHRAQAAQSALRSQSVQRFGAGTTAAKPVWNGSGVATTSVSGVALAPRHAAPTAAQPQQIQHVAVRPHAQHNPHTAPVRRQAASAGAHRPHAPAVQPAHEDDQDIFVRALADARSHEEAAPTVKHHKGGRRIGRILGVTASIAVFVGLAGFVAFQNRDDIRLQLASAKAGFPASAPLYKPDGFALSSMKYTAGSVASVYQHGSNQNFTITQEKSNWDSQTLLENFVATNSGDYQGFQSNGRTVYVYGKGNATWVNGGVWYKIKASGDLSNEQLVRIAASM